MCCYGNQQLQLADVKHFQIFTIVSGDGMVRSCPKGKKGFET